MREDVKLKFCKSEGSEDGSCRDVTAGTYLCKSTNKTMLERECSHRCMKHYNTFRNGPGGREVRKYIFSLEEKQEHWQ